MLADSVFERALAAEASGKLELATELIERLPADSPQLLRWNAPAHLSVTTHPPSSVTIAEYRLDPDTLRRELGPARALGDTPIAALELAQGSYQLTLALADDHTIVYPVKLGRDEPLQLDLKLPRREQIPKGFIYVPEGRFLYGSPDEEIIRKFFVTVPQHEVTTPAYLIAQHETTYAEWLAFLRDLPPAERARYLPSSDTMLLGAGIALTSTNAGQWSLTIPAGEKVLKAQEHEPIVYPGRPVHATQNWLNMPISGVNLADANAYLGWLDRTGRLAGARLCNDWEWERAARGADERRYPHGDSLRPEEANIDLTYGKEAENRGPDVVGLHPVSRSPFGLDDMSGNTWEWVSLARDTESGVIRGGAFAYEETSSASMNRTSVSADTRDSTVGIRVCAPLAH